MICHRNFFRKIKRYSIEEVTGAEEHGIIPVIFIGNIQIHTNLRSQNGTWLHKLIRAKVSPNIPKTKGQIEVSQNRGLILFMPLFSIVLTATAFAIPMPDDPNLKIVLCVMGMIFTIGILISELPFLRRKLFYDENQVIYIDYKKQEHRFYWEDLSGFHHHGDILCFRFGEEDFCPMMAIPRKERFLIIRTATAIAEKKIDTIRKSQGDLEGDRAHLEMFYLQHRGKLFRRNFLNHIEAYAHIIIVGFCVIFITLVVLSDKSGISPLDVIFILFIWAVIPIITLTYVFLDRMPYSYVQMTKRYYPLSLNFLRKLPHEKRAQYADLVLSKKDMETLDIVGLFPLPAKYKCGQSETTIPHEEAKKIIEQEQKEREIKQKHEDRAKLILYGAALFICLYFRFCTT